MYIRQISRIILISTTLFLIFISNNIYGLDLTILCLTKERGVLRSTNNGRSWRSFNEGLPNSFTPVKLYSDSTKIYLATFSRGIFQYNNKAEQWISINDHDFRRRSIYKKNPGCRKISAFAIDPENPNNLVLATKHTLYQSQNGGRTWRLITKRGLQRRIYITALAIRKKTIAVGTSFNGVLISTGGTFRKRNNGLPGEPYSSDRKFSETISALFIAKNYIYSGTCFGKGLYRISRQGRTWQNITLKDMGPFSSIGDIKASTSSIYSSLGNSIRIMNTKRKNWRAISGKSIIEELPDECTTLGALVIDPTRKIPSLYLDLYRPNGRTQIGGSKKRAIYASVPSVRRNLPRVIRYIKKSNCNALVIDMKDDFGLVHFNSKLKAVKEMRARRRSLNIPKLISKLHKNGIYAIARIVVFKDKRIFHGYKNRYCIKNRRTGRPWQGNELEFWVDPYSKFVQTYTINLSIELQNLGFDEIQFDYIRFPSDGPIGLCHYSYKKDRHTYKSEILADFLWKAKQSLTVPLSVDIYGFNSWYHFGNLIGQDMEEFSQIVDVICPMVYPSHFGSRFYRKRERSKRPYRIVHDGGIRAHHLVRNSVVIRPYLQAFNMMSPTWGPGYIRNQVIGAEKSLQSGFTFWNAGGDYKMVVRALQKK